MYLKQISKLSATFCKRAVLKTYLEVIPPHRIHEMMESKEHTLSQLISKYANPQPLPEPQDENQELNIVEQSSANLRQLKSIEAGDLKKIEKYIAKRLNYIDLKTLIKLALMCLDYKRALLAQQPSSTVAKRLNSIFNRILASVVIRNEDLPVDDMILLIYNLAKRNFRHYELMKALEDVIIEENIPINYLTIRKLLFAYTHLDMGSTVLYNHICKTIKVGQYELEPLQIAQFAYMLSKVSQDIRNGYGVYEIAEKRLADAMASMSFKYPQNYFRQLVEASSYMLTQNIGNNLFQLELEKKLYEKYPLPAKLQVKTFVQLLKSLSSYYFKYQDSSLLYLLQNSSKKVIKRCTVEQLAEVLWSWGRSKKGDKELWHSLQHHILQRLPHLKTRQFIFCYHSLCGIEHISCSTLKRFQEKIEKLLPQLQPPLQVKLLTALQSSNRGNLQLFTRICMELIPQINSITIQQFVKILTTVNNSELDFNSQGQQLMELKGLILHRITDICNKLYKLKIGEVVELFYFWTKLQLFGKGENETNGKFIIEKCMVYLSEPHLIPKKSFIKAMLCFTIHDQYAHTQQMLSILEEMQKYGPIGYFFSPYEFPLLAYSLLTYEVHIKPGHISRKLMKAAIQGLKGIEEVILNSFVRTGMEEAKRLVAIYEQKANRTK